MRRREAVGPRRKAPPLPSRVVNCLIRSGGSCVVSRIQCLPTRPIRGPSSCAWQPPAKRRFRPLRGSTTDNTSRCMPGPKRLVQTTAAAAARRCGSGLDRRRDRAGPSPRPARNLRRRRCHPSAQRGNDSDCPKVTCRSEQSDLPNHDGCSLVFMPACGGSQRISSGPRPSLRGQSYVRRTALRGRRSS
jgi:hypothetical protein